MYQSRITIEPPGFNIEIMLSIMLSHSGSPENPKSQNTASNFFKHECVRARLEVFQTESETMGVDFILKTKTGKYIEVDLRIINLEEKDRSIKIPKSEWNYELPENRWVAFVTLMKNLDPAIYLLNCSEFEKLNQFIINNEQPEKFQAFLKLGNQGYSQSNEFFW